MSDFGGTITTSQLCEIADITPEQIRTWKARWRERGISLLPGSDGWTRYTFVQVMQITLIAELSELKTNPIDTAQHVLNLHGFRGEDAYLVISSGMLGRILPTSPRGAPAPSRDEGAKHHEFGMLYSDVVKASELAPFLSDSDRYASIVYNLTNLERRLKAAWPDSEKTEG